MATNFLPSWTLDELDHDLLRLSPPDSIGCLPRPRVHALIPRDASSRDRLDTHQVAYFLKNTGPSAFPAREPLKPPPTSARPPQRLMKRNAKQKSGLFRLASRNKSLTGFRPSNVVECVSNGGAKYLQIVPKELTTNIDALPSYGLVNLSYNSTARPSVELQHPQRSTSRSFTASAATRNDSLFTSENSLRGVTEDTDTGTLSVQESDNIITGDLDRVCLTDYGNTSDGNSPRRDRIGASRQERMEKARGRVLRGLAAGDALKPGFETAGSIPRRSSSFSDLHSYSGSLNPPASTVEFHRVHTPVHFEGGVTDARAALMSNPVLGIEAPTRPLPEVPENYGHSTKRLSMGSRSQHIDEALEALRKSSQQINASLQEAKLDKTSNQGRRRTSRDRWPESLSISSAPPTVQYHHHDGAPRSLAPTANEARRTQKSASLTQNSEPVESLRKHTQQISQSSIADSVESVKHPRVAALGNDSHHSRTSSQSRRERTRALKLRDLTRHRPSIDEVIVSADDGEQEQGSTGQLAICNDMASSRMPEGAMDHEQDDRAILCQFPEAPGAKTKVTLVASPDGSNARALEASSNGSDPTMLGDDLAQRTIRDRRGIFHSPLSVVPTKQEPLATEFPLTETHAAAGTEKVDLNYNNLRTPEMQQSRFSASTITNTPSVNEGTPPQDIALRKPMLLDTTRPKYQSYGSTNSTNSRNYVHAPGAAVESFVSRDTSWPSSTSRGSDASLLVAPHVFGHQSRLEARIELLERENKLLEAALMAVLKTSGKLNGCLCGGDCPGNIAGQHQQHHAKGRTVPEANGGEGALDMYMRSRRTGRGLRGASMEYGGGSAAAAAAGAVVAVGEE